LGAKYLVVLCAGSTLLLVQSKDLDEAPYKLSGAIAKLAGITFWCLAFSYWFDKPRFLTEGKFAAVLIIPSCWGSQLDGDLHQHRAATSRVPNWVVICQHQSSTPPSCSATALLPGHMSRFEGRGGGTQFSQI
jgi:hypothetical protein